MNVIDYVTEEVTRQGHDVTTLDGIERVGWMLNAWAWAMEQEIIDMEGAVFLGKMVEPIKNIRGLRTVGVRVGTRRCPAPELVQGLLAELFRFRGRHGMDPIEFYRQFELIHPFVDGNGRSGKIILNHMNGSLTDPIFPPSDLFGHPIGNP